MDPYLGLAQRSWTFRGGTGTIHLKVLKNVNGKYSRISRYGKTYSKCKTSLDAKLGSFNRNFLSKCHTCKSYIIIKVHAPYKSDMIPFHWAIRTCKIGIIFN